MCIAELTGARKYYIKVQSFVANLQLLKHDWIMNVFNLSRVVGWLSGMVWTY